MLVPHRTQSVPDHFANRRQDRSWSSTTVAMPVSPPSLTPTPIPPSNAPGPRATTNLIAPHPSRRLRLSHYANSIGSTRTSGRKPDNDHRYDLLRHFAVTRFPFGANLEADELFAFSASHEAVARLMHLRELLGVTATATNAE